MNTVYIGYDSKQEHVYQALKYSIEQCAAVPLKIIPLKQAELRQQKLYTREFYQEQGQCYDSIDQRPFSTEFSFSRFLVPFLHGQEGWALFMDCDMMLRNDINQLFEQFNDPQYAFYCVKHNYQPEEGTKMDGQIQQAYNRKNWSSFMLWNCAHEANQKLTLDDVNQQTGRWLHNFNWLPDNQKEQLIGELPEAWNWLDGHSDPAIDAHNVHFTTGGPWYKTWQPHDAIEQQYAEQWSEIAKQLNIIVPEEQHV